MVKTFADALMSAEADALCGASYGRRRDERTNHRNGYRPREWDTRAGTVGLAIPKLRHGFYFPDLVVAAPSAGRAGPGEPPRILWRLPTLRRWESCHHAHRQLGVLCRRPGYAAL